MKFRVVSIPRISALESEKKSRESKNKKILLPVEEGEGTITIVKLLEETPISAIGFTSGDLVFYNMASFEALTGFREHSSPISCIQTSKIEISTPLGAQSTLVLLTGSSERDSSIIVWKISFKGGLFSIDPIKKLSGHSHLISSILSLPETSCIVTSSFDSKIAIWDLSEKFTCIQIMEESKSPVLCLDYSFDKDLVVSGCLDGCILIYTVKYDLSHAGKNFNGCFLVNKLDSKCNILEVGFFDSGDAVMTLESDFNVKIYDTKSGNTLKEFNLSGMPIIDFFVVEARNMRTNQLEPSLYVLDNRNNVYKFTNWVNKPDQVVFSMKQTSKKNKRVFSTQFVGYSPKS